MLKCLLLEKPKPLYPFIFKWWTEICTISECFVVFLVCMLQKSVLLSDLSFLCGCDHPCSLLSYQKMMPGPLGSLCCTVTPNALTMMSCFSLENVSNSCSGVSSLFLKKRNIWCFTELQVTIIYNTTCLTCTQKVMQVPYVKKIFLRWGDDRGSILQLQFYLKWKEHPL